MDDELDGRISALEMALLTVTMAMEDIPQTAIQFRLRHARSRMARHEPGSERTKTALEYFDRFLSEEPDQGEFPK